MCFFNELLHDHALMSHHYLNHESKKLQIHICGNEQLMGDMLESE